MIFDPINWKIYNKPPFYPQYLAKGETLKLISFDDSQLAEIDTQIRAMANQYDLDNAKAALLDRIGKNVSEPRDGNDDDLYRLLIRLRILLNTTNGSVPDVIKVIKFLFSSEVVHIAPNYPAGISILHDGEGPNIDFNRIIAQVVGAGIAYDTKELFDFVEDLLLVDTLKLKAIRADEDSFHGLKYNGAIKYDGHTINEKIVGKTHYDGTFRYDGSIKYNGLGKFPNLNKPRPPFKYNSGIYDLNTVTMKIHSLTDEQISRQYYDGSIKYNGAAKYNGKSPVSISDPRMLFQITMAVIEDFPVFDLQTISVARDMEDTTRKPFKYDGSVKYDGSRTYSGDTVDKLTSKLKITESVEDPKAWQKFNGSIKYNGAAKYNGQAPDFISEPIMILNIGMDTEDATPSVVDSQQLSVVVPNIEDINRKQIKYDGSIKYNGKFTYSGDSVDQLRMELSTEETIESEEINEDCFIGLRNHHYFNGVYKYNGAIKYNSSSLIPLE